MLVVVTLHDREELVQPCLSSLLSKAGLDFSLVVVADDCDFDPTPYIGNAISIVGKFGSPAAARNAALPHRSPGEDLMTVDSDITFLSDGWLASLKRTLDRGYGAVSACIGNPGPPWFHRIEPNTGIHETLALPVGSRLYAGAVMDALGAFRSYGPYGMEDVDIDSRMTHSGWKMAYDSSVVVSHPGVPADDPWKRQQLERTLPLFKQWEVHYAAGRYLYQDPDQPFFPRLRLLPTSETEAYGSHLPYLKKAVAATDGPVLEVGSGFYSTPYLASLDRPVVTVEHNRNWRESFAEHYGSPRHAFTDQLPDGRFSVALIDQDGPGTPSRGSTIAALRDRVEIFVCHDTEDQRFDYQVLDTFTHRLDSPESKPQTSVVSDRFALSEV